MEPRSLVKFDQSSIINKIFYTNLCIAYNVTIIANRDYNKLFNFSTLISLIFLYILILLTLKKLFCIIIDKVFIVSFCL